MPLPRISTKFLINDLEKKSKEEKKIHIKRRYLPKEIVEKIISWNQEFQIARIKQYHYSKFLEQYGASLVRSSSRLKVYNRELKSMGMKYHTSTDTNCSFKSFVKFTKKNKLRYNYEKLKSLFI